MQHGRVNRGPLPAGFVRARLGPEIPLVSSLPAELSRESRFQVDTDWGCRFVPSFPPLFDHLIGVSFNSFGKRTRTTPCGQSRKMSPCFRCVNSIVAIHGLFFFLRVICRRCCLVFCVRRHRMNRRRASPVIQPLEAAADH